MTQKIALIIGVSGQDGAYLANFLINKGYKVYGTSRFFKTSNFYNLNFLGIFEEVEILPLHPESFNEVLGVIKKSTPSEIYYLAGQSSVNLSFEKPTETIQSAIIGILNVLEACRLLDDNYKIYHAGSSECFGNTINYAANEKTPFYPRSPYAVAKASAFWLVTNYREAYNLFASTGILFNHESPLRPSHFVIKKIISSAQRISKGSKEILSLGNINIVRDWGWAPEYVEAMWLILQQDKPEDFVIATGESISLKDLIHIVFKKFNLNSELFIKESANFYRPTDISISKADPSKAKHKLGWRAKYNVYDVVERLCEY